MPANSELPEGYEGFDLLPEFTPDQVGVLGKALALIEQIRPSPQARAFLEKLCLREQIKPIGLKTYSQIRWGSLYFTLERFLYLRKVCYYHIIYNRHTL